MSSKADAIRDELLQCRDRNGRITPKAVVARARRNPRGLLYRQFGRLWNARAAQEMALQDRARELMTTYLTVVVIHRNTKYTVPRYVKDPDIPHQEQGSVDMTSPRFTLQNAQQTVQQEIDRSVAIIQRARGVAAVLDQRFPGLFDQLDAALDALVCARHAAAGRPRST